MAFWEKDGVRHQVKNLGWLLRHAEDVRQINIKRLPDGTADFVADLSNGRKYITLFQSFDVACDWVNRPSLAHAIKSYSAGEHNDPR